MIYLCLPWLPPSSNAAYKNIPRGRALTVEASAFKRVTPLYLHQHFPEELLFFQKRKNVALTLAVRFVFRQVENKGWPKTVSHRYKKLDTSNRLKLLEDALAEAAGVDDSQNVTLAIQKVKGAKEQTEVWVWDPEEEESPFDEIFIQLRTP